jgi:hypothetical protein
MRRLFAQDNSFPSFLRKLAVALPANLVVFWLVLQGDTPAILLYSVISALLGAVLLMALEGRAFPSEAKVAPNVEARRRAAVHEFPHYSRPA